MVPEPMNQSCSLRREALTAPCAVKSPKHIHDDIQADDKEKNRRVPSRMGVQIQVIPAQQHRRKTTIFEPCDNNEPAGQRRRACAGLGLAENRARGCTAHPLASKHIPNLKDGNTRINMPVTKWHLNGTVAPAGPLFACRGPTAEFPGSKIRTTNTIGGAIPTRPQRAKRPGTRPPATHPAGKAGSGFSHASSSHVPQHARRQSEEEKRKVVLPSDKLNVFSHPFWRQKIVSLLSTQVKKKMGRKQH